MEAFILDASVALSWCFPNDPAENTPYSRTILQWNEEADVVMPEIWAFETANVVLSYTVYASGSVEPISPNISAS